MLRMTQQVLNGVISYLTQGIQIPEREYLKARINIGLEYGGHLKTV